MTEAELTRLAVRVLEACGLAPGEAADAAQILVIGDLMGHGTHGVLRLESYGERLRSGAMDARARIAVEDLAPAIARVDGANAVGPLVGRRALRDAMTRARAHGVGIAFARNSNHFGAIAPYCLLAADEGFASMICSNASVTIAPTGAAETRLGNNPLGFGVPRPGGRPVILDMAMSVVARARRFPTRGPPIAQAAPRPIPRPRSMDSCSRSAATRGTASPWSSTSSPACCPMPRTSRT